VVGHPAIKRLSGSGYQGLPGTSRGKSRCKLMVLRMDRDGEFTSKEFMEYYTVDGVTWN
jgi:hypothetical protein